MASTTAADELDSAFLITCHKLDTAEECENILKSKFQLKVLTFNIRSIGNHFDHFLVLLKRINVDFDIIILTECWLNENTLVGTIEGYSVFRTTIEFNKAGGVVTYVKSNLNATMHEPNVSEANCLVIEIPDVVTLLGIYRSPSFENPTSFLESLEELLNSTPSKGKQILLAGDINIDILADTNKKKKFDYLCITAEHGLIPAITQPTRQDSCLDHIFISQKIQAEAIVCKTDITDHYVAIVGLNYAATKPSKKRLITKIDYASVESEIEAIDWTRVTELDDLEEAANIFMETITSIINKNTKTITVSRSKYNIKPWITPGLIKCMKNRDTLHAKYRKDPDCIIKKTTYLRYRNFFTNLLHTLKHEHEKQMLEQSRYSPKKLWTTIKDICYTKTPKSSATSLLTIEIDELASINKCNEYFSTIGQKLANKTLSTLGETEDSLASKRTVAAESVPSLFLNPTDALEIKTIIKNLPTQSAPGLDGINNKLIKRLNESLAGPLAHICNISMSDGKFPEVWKTAAVSPIHKSGPKNDPANYRPISLLATFSKVLEKIVNKRLVNFIENHNLLSNRQYGFRRGMSTEDAVGDLVNLVTSVLDGGEACIGVFLDLAKAFDTVSVPILLNKLESFGIRGVVLEWFRSYLSLRRQRIKINNSVSDSNTVTFGVPQGSILGPTLFIIYLNDISSVRNCDGQLFCYADDTAVVFRGSSWEAAARRADQGMAMIADWLGANLLTLNTDKTKFVTFHRTRASEPPSPLSVKAHFCGKWRTEIGDEQNTPNSVTCQCPELFRTSAIKYLGITLDQFLSFKEHIHIMSGRVRKVINIMKLLRNSAEKELLREIYIAICQSLICYCLPIWGGAAKTHLIELERAQRSVIKVMLKKEIKYPTEKLHKDSKLLSVRGLFVYRSALLKHRVSLQCLQLDRRRVPRIPVKRVKTSFAQRLPEFLHPFIYNKLIKEITDLVSLTMREAKIKLNNYLMKLNYTAIENIIKVAG